MRGEITRWSPGLGAGELLGADRRRYLFTAADISSSAWPPSEQDQLARPWVPGQGTIVEFTPRDGRLGRQAVRVMRRRPLGPSASGS